MKLFLFLIFVSSLVITIIFANFLSPKELAIKWNAFKRNYSKNYEPDEELFRKEVFRKNYEKMLEQNRKFKLGLSKWSARVYDHFDLTKEEFKRNFGGLTTSESKEKADRIPPADYLMDEKAYPDTWDIRTQGPGKINPVRHQGSCSSCWAHAAAFAIESAWSVKTGELYSLSVQQQIDCNKNCHGCLGANSFEDTFKYPVVGLTTEKNYPYLGVNGTCNETAILVCEYLTKVIRLPVDEATMKKYISSNGACAVGVNADNWEGYSGGIYDSASPDFNIMNHAVGLIGYGPDYWLLRNSWGLHGENGYIRISNKKSGGMFYDTVYCAII